MEFDQIRNWRKSHFHKFDEVDRRKYINLLKYVGSIIYIKMMKMTKWLRSWSLFTTAEVMPSQYTLSMIQLLPPYCVVPHWNKGKFMYLNHTHTWTPPKIHPVGGAWGGGWGVFWNWPCHFYLVTLSFSQKRHSYQLDLNFGPTHRPLPSFKSQIPTQKRLCRCRFFPEKGQIWQFFC